MSISGLQREHVGQPSGVTSITLMIIPLSMMSPVAFSNKFARRNFATLLHRSSIGKGRMKTVSSPRAITRNAFGSQYCRLDVSRA